MTTHELLNNIAHKDLRVITRHSADYGENVHAVLTFPTEYADIMREYPIFFRRDPAKGDLQSVALLGFEKGENLFLEGHEWRARYTPAVIARGPFLIGFQEKEVDGELRREPVVHVDVDDPRVNRTEGEPVFREHGGNTRYLDRISTILDTIQRGLAVEKAMFASFEKYGLISPAEVRLDLHTDRQIVMQGFHTIDHKVFSALGGDALAELNQRGFLQAAVLVMHSLANVNRMIDIRNRRAAVERVAPGPAR